MRLKIQGGNNNNYSNNNKKILVILKSYIFDTMHYDEAIN